MRIALVIVMFLFTSCGMAWSQIAATQPQCYEIVGCPHKDRITEAQARDLGCEQLWLVRNTIYYQHGYCFATDRGREAFSNARCTTSSVEGLQFNPIERANIATLKAEEQRQHCQ